MKKIPKSPNENLKCLLISPRFSAFSFWNYVDAAKTTGAKTPSPPLGLLTVAALLPQNWEFKLLDLNCVDFSQELWEWADLVCVGGMLPQQEGIVEIIERANRDGKYVAVGGADPTSQPSLYDSADVLIVGEGEELIPHWIKEWEKGQPCGVFREQGKPDLTKSPVPRFDLIDFKDYVLVGVQYSRGCPFNCEFCDIIELFGRKPRIKTPKQFCNELTRLKELGYSGMVDIVDDNFIGIKRNIKRYLLPALINWNKKNKYPFFYSTEASMNLADDTQLLELMSTAEFRVVFMGIETPDPELLLKTQKSQNTIRPIVDRVKRCYEYGIIVTAGFIVGFDGEKSGLDKSMVALIEDTGINMAMVGLLVALPNTQLTRRLHKEGRLLDFQGNIVNPSQSPTLAARAKGSSLEVVDQTVSGLNFITTRPRSEIIKEYQSVIEQIYSPKSYFDRTLKTCKKIRGNSRHLPRPFELKRNLRGLVNVCINLSKEPSTRWLFWRNFFLLLFRGPLAFEHSMRIMGMYLHFKKQSSYLLNKIENNQHSYADQNSIKDLQEAT